MSLTTQSSVPSQLQASSSHALSSGVLSPAARPARTPLKGRGTSSNISHRYTQAHSEYMADGWYEEAPAGRVATQIFADQAKSIITTNSSPDVPFSKSINPYQGCEHGCVYCYARPSHAYWDSSPGLEFETKLFYKSNAAQLLEESFKRKSYQCEPIVLGSNTDPYQPIENTLNITRQLIEVMAEHRHPFSIITKSAGVLRDLPLLSELAEQNLCNVFLSVTTLDDVLKRRLEPRAAAPQARLQAIKQLTDAGVPVGVLVAPIIPALNDAELEDILEACSSAGARAASYIFIRLPHEVRLLFREWLATHYPEKFNHVMNLIRESRGGKENSYRFGERMRGTGNYAGMIKQRFMLKRNQLGLGDRLAALDTSQFTHRSGVADQLALF